jgi:hypothetical protein
MQSDITTTMVARGARLRFINWERDFETSRGPIRSKNAPLPIGSSNLSKHPADSFLDRGSAYEKETAKAIRALVGMKPGR